ncbi:MAG: DeoR/GlpR family DNA-binding transcription regulator [Bowdeniella nasicola]|nr:DeoR/GlpR family DNA-binding transcription regulator [Bowdeniella nasicola]
MERHARLRAITDHVQREGAIRVDEVVERFDVSLATARRDLDALAEQQLLVRTHGGASRTPDSASLPVGFRTGRATQDKHRIACRAATLVNPGAVVGMNGGTTTTHVARQLALLTQGEGELTIVTNAVNIAYEMTVRRGIRVVTTGGVARPHTYELTGPLAQRFFTDLNLDVTFLGVDGIDAGGIYAANEAEAAVNRALASAASRVIVVADAEKIGARAFARILPGTAIGTLITTAPADHPVLAALTRTGTQVITVRPG